MESEFSGSMRVHVFTLCPKCIQSFIISIQDYKCKRSFADHFSHYEDNTMTYFVSLKRKLSKTGKNDCNTQQREFTIVNNCLVGGWL